MLSPRGQLGLPTLPDAEAMLGYVHAFHRRTELSDALERRLAADPRAAQLEGRALQRGSGRGAYQTLSMASWWIWRANGVGPRQADAELNAYLSHDRVETWHCYWIHGVEVSTPVPLGSNLVLMPWNAAPVGVQWERTAREAHGFLRYSNEPRAFVLLIDEDVRDYAIGEQAPFAWRDDEMVPATAVLNLAPGICAVPGIYELTTAPHVPPGAFGGAGHSRRHLDIRARQHTAFRPPSDCTMDALLAAYHRLSANDQKRWLAALRRLSHAKAHTAPEDQALDLVMALEMVLMVDAPHRNRSQTFVERATAAMELSSDATREALRRLYTIRSQVVHSGASAALGDGVRTAHAEVQGYLTLGESLLRRKLLSDGQAS